MRRSGSERLQMGCAMFDTARAFARRASGRPPTVTRNLRARLFVRTYGGDFDPATTEKIAAWLSRPHRGCRKATPTVKKTPHRPAENARDAARGISDQLRALILPGASGRRQWSAPHHPPPPDCPWPLPVSEAGTGPAPRRRGQSRQILRQPLRLRLYACDMCYECFHGLILHVLEALAGCCNCIAYKESRSRPEHQLSWSLYI